MINAFFEGLPREISQAFLKTKTWRPPPLEPIRKCFRRDEEITFSELDAVLHIRPHSDAVVIKMILGNKKVQKVYVDTVSTVNIIYNSCFEKLGIDQRNLKPSSPLKAFAQNEVISKRVITLPATLGDPPNTKPS